MLSEGAGEMFRVLGIELLPGAEVGEGITFGGGAGGVDFGSLVVLSVGAAPEADGVVVFESETGGIDGLVTAGAGFVVAMFFELVANAGGSANIGFDGRYAWWWWRDVVAKNALIDEDAAHNRGSAGAIGSDFEDRSLSHEASAL